MDGIEFRYDNSLVSAKKIKGFGGKLRGEILRLKDALEKSYQTDYASINLPFDKANLNKVKALVQEKLKLKPGLLIVIGIGGSNLGTIAVSEAVLGKLYDLTEPKTKVLFLDTTDSDYSNQILGVAKKYWRAKKRVLVNVISKSGGTTETIALFEAVLAELRKYERNPKEFVVVTTDVDSPLWNLAYRYGFSLLGIPKKVGGRYSVFSSVGLFPLGILGIDIEKLVEGARDFIGSGIETNILNNPAAISAVLIYLNWRNKRNIYDNFLFSNDFEALGKWYRQLMGESIGKEWNKTHKKRVFSGITPTVSIGSTDLHSMAQLYLGGPRDKFTNFVWVKENKINLALPKFDEYSVLVPHIQEKSLSTIMAAILEGVKIAFRKGKRPFTETILADKSEYSIGQFLQFKMLEMMYLAYLLDVNAFDQPNVEDYKVETKRILSEG